jgi:hypothetical protein
MSLKSLKNQTLRNKSTLNSVNLTGGASTGPVITSIVVTDSNYNNLDDTALLPAGGYAKLIGSGFASGCSAYFNGSSVTTTFVSATEVRVVIPATSVGTYNVMLFNPSTAGAIYLNLGISNAPTFTTTAGSLGTSYETQAVSTSIAATGDTPITYALYSGSLPTGVTLASNGTLSGTSPVEASTTTYSFVVQATDAQLQDTTRSFSLTISTDVVTWSTPAADFAYTLVGNETMANVSLLATSAAGYGVTYAANTLPTGVSLSGNTIFGTPTVEQTVYTALTATANTTGRTATRFVSWIVSLGDPFFEYVSMMLPGTGTNGAQNNTFVDSSTNNFTITRNGNTTQGTFSPYGPNWSNYFDGNGDYLTVPTTTALSFGTGDFTVEVWVYKTAAENASVIDARANPGTASPWGFFVDGSNFPYFYNGTTYTSAVAITLNAWNHIAAVREGGGLSIYVNGARGLLVPLTASLDRTAGAFIGMVANTSSPSSYWRGYLSNLRVVKGTAVYTAAFTPPTAPLTAVTNTSLLTCQSNRFIDNSTNNFAITKNGDVSVQRFSPFSPSAAYSLSTTGGSGYFDGTGDYLTFSPSVSFAFGTGNFTVEGWVFNTGSAEFALFDSTVNGSYWGLRLTPTAIYYQSASGQVNKIAATGVLTGKNNSWVHIALVRLSGTSVIYVNGVSVASVVDTTNYTATTTYQIGKTSDGAYYMNGYISDARVVKGTAVYTANFTPPTAPVTAITNTSLLLNFTNAGIIDNAMLNNLETVGNAQISTAQSKFGGSSMFFDGTGDYLLTPVNSTFTFGTGDFTIEMWIYTLNVTNTVFLLDSRQAAGTAGPYACLMIPAGGTLQWFVNGAAQIGPIGSVPINTWAHVAVCRSSGVTKMYLNGTNIGSPYTDTNNYSYITQTIFGGNSFAFTSNNFPGYIDDLRITKGYARYTANFTPPTAALPTS